MRARWIDETPEAAGRRSLGAAGLLLAAFVATGCRGADSGVGGDGDSGDWGPAPPGAGRTHQAPDGGIGRPVADAGGAPKEKPDAGGDASLSMAVDDLVFVAVGDTRPATADDGAGYPTSTIDTIFTDIAALSPAPAFVVGTGDYQYSTPSLEFAAPQLDIYLSARASYPGPFFPTMGNHECTGSTSSNCGPGSTDGVTVTYSAYLAKMLAPIGQPLPYYELKIAAKDASWTAKCLFVAANAWSDAQATWLDATMAEPTTYTFIVRHEPAESDTAPGVTPSEAIMAKHPYTLAIVGHVHTYERSGQRELIVGNGGAPLGSTVDYGFALFTRGSDGSITASMIDYMSGQASQTFSVNADGSDPT